MLPIQYLSDHRQNLVSEFTSSTRLFFNMLQLQITPVQHTHKVSELSSIGFGGFQEEVLFFS